MGEWASELAAAFLQDTVQNVRDAGLPLTLTTTEPGAPEFASLGVQQVDQGSGDLGARLEHVLQRGLASHARVAAIGADSPGLPEALLTEAFRGDDACIVPTDDGGFALLALSRCPDGLFAALPWSMPHTCDAVVERLEAHGMTVRRLQTWFDVDTAADLERLAELPIARIPHTSAVLQQMRSGDTSCTTEEQSPERT